MINLTWNLIIAHVSMNELHIKILNNSIINIIITHVDIFRGQTYATRKIKICWFKEIFDIEFNCAENKSSIPLACRQRPLNGTVLRTRPQKPRRCTTARDPSLFTGHWCRRIQPLTAMVSIRCHNIVLFVGGWGVGGGVKIKWLIDYI